MKSCNAIELTGSKKTKNMDTMKVLVLLHFKIKYLKVLILISRQVNTHTSYYSHKVSDSRDSSWKGLALVQHLDIQWGFFLEAPAAIEVDAEWHIVPVCSFLLSFPVRLKGMV